MLKTITKLSCERVWSKKDHSHPSMRSKLKAVARTIATLITSASYCNCKNSPCTKQKPRGLGRFFCPIHSSNSMRPSASQCVEKRRPPRNVLAEPDVNKQFATSEIHLKEVWDSFVQLHQKRRNALGQLGCFSDENFERFLKSATKGLMELNRSDLIVINKSGTPIAAMLLIYCGETCMMYQSGIDPDCEFFGAWLPIGQWLQSNTLSRMTSSTLIFFVATSLIKRDGVRLAKQSCPTKICPSQHVSAA